MKLKYKIISGFAGIGILPLLVLSYIIVEQSKKTIESEVKDSLISIRDNKKQQLDSYLKDLRTQLISLANDRTTIKAFDALDIGFTQLADFDLDESSIRLRNMYRQEEAGEENKESDELEEDEEEEDNYYTESHSRYHPFFLKQAEKLGVEDFLIFSNNGYVVYSLSKGIEIGRSVDDELFYNTPVPATYKGFSENSESEAFLFSDFFNYNKQKRNPIAFISVPVRLNKKFLGILAARYPIKIQNQLINTHSGLGELGRVYLTGRDYKMRSDLKIFDLSLTINSTFDDSKEKIDLENSQFVKQAFDEISGFNTGTDFLNEKVLRAYTKVDIWGRTWYLFAEMNFNEAYKPLTDLQNYMMIIIAFTLISSIIVSFAISISISKPTQNLAEVVKKMGDGDLNVRADIKSHDEIGYLGKKLNKMASDLQKNIADKEKAQKEQIEASEKLISITKEQNKVLDEKVKERTKTLVQKNKDIQDILQNLKQGIFNIVEDNIIHSEYSHYLHKILNTDHIENRNVKDILFEGSNISKNDIDQVENTLLLSIGEDLMNFELNSHLFPNEIIKTTNNEDDKILEIDWQPITAENNVVTKIMVVVRDVTELRSLRNEAEQRKEELDILGQIFENDVNKIYQVFEDIDIRLEIGEQILDDNTLDSSDIVCCHPGNLTTLQSFPI